MPWINGQSSGTRIANGGGIVTVNADGSVSVTPAANKIVKDGGLPGVTRPQWYGAKFDGVTDDTAAWVATLAAVYAAGGGTVECPPGISLILGQLVVPNNGAASPRQVNMVWRGMGAHADASTGTPPSGGTVLDLRYAGATAKIVTLGAGLLEITGITFADKGAGDSTPYLLATGTNVQAHHNAFYGNPTKSGVTCDQDAIVLGGTGVVNDGTANSMFQGYGTVIQNNFFDRIRRAVLGQSDANSVVVRDNTIWNGCGSNLANGAAIEFTGVVGKNAVGNVVADNLIEMPGYPYGVKFGANTVTNTARGNSFWDPAAGTTLAYVRCEAGSHYTSVVAGYGDDTYPYLSDASGTAAIITAHQSQSSVFPRAISFGGRLTAADGSTGPVGLILLDSSGNTFYEQASGGVALQFSTVPSGGAAEVIASFQRSSATDKRLELAGTTNSRVEAQNSQLQLIAKAGTLTSIGDVALPQNVYALSGVLHAVWGIVPGATAGGSTLYTGSGAPSLPGGVASVRVGDVYFRSDTPTVANQFIYVCTVGGATPTWVGKV